MRTIGLLALVNFLWALQFPAARVATQELGPLTLTWFAMLLATLLAMPIAWVERRVPRQPAPSGWRSYVLPIIALGLSGSLVSQLCLNWGLESAPASNASVINLSVPALMAALASLLLGESMTRTRWIAFGLSVPGVLLASDISWSETRFFETRYFMGNMLILLGCCGSAFYNVFSKRVLDWLGPAQLLASTFAVSLVAMLPAMLIYEPGVAQRFQKASTASIVALVVVGAISLAAATMLYFRLLGEVEATQASLSIYFLPVFGVLLSGAALRETVSSTLLAGGAMVGAGAWIVTAQENRAKRSLSSQ